MLSFTAALIPGVVAFSSHAHSAVSPQRVVVASSRGSSLRSIRCEGKTYQLEELEDSNTCTTEIFLHEDRSIQFGDSDGPVFEGAAGRWDMEPGTEDFIMCVQRRYGGGRDGTDMGEFAFDVWRTFSGEMKMVGDSVAINGVMYDGDSTNFEGSKQVGYFNMIDGTDDKLSYAERAGNLRVS